MCAKVQTKRVCDASGGRADGPPTARPSSRKLAFLEARSWVFPGLSANDSEECEPKYIGATFPQAAPSREPPAAGGRRSAAVQPGSSLFSVLNYGLRIAHSYKPALCAGRRPKPAPAPAKRDQRVSPSLIATLLGAASARLHCNASAVQPGASTRRGALSLIGLLGTRNTPKRAGARPRGGGSPEPVAGKAQESRYQSGVASLLACSPFFTAWQTPFSRTSSVTPFEHRSETRCGVLTGKNR